MQEQWSYGTGLLKEGNEVEIAMQAVDGYYPATAGITLTADVVDYALYTMQPFVGAPSLELYTDEGLVATYRLRCDGERVLGYGRGGSGRFRRAYLADLG